MSWLPVAGFESFYEVSSGGQVRRAGTQRVRKQRHSRDGYLMVNLTRPGVRRNLQVGVLVARAFVGPRPEGQQVRHLNGVRDDNRAVNLAYGTPKQNMQDKLDHGNNASARKTHCPQGHSYDEKNTRWDSRGRTCRACHRASVKRAKAAKKEALWLS